MCKFQLGERAIERECLVYPTMTRRKTKEKDTDHNQTDVIK